MPCNWDVNVQERRNCCCKTLQNVKDWKFLQTVLASQKEIGPLRHKRDAHTTLMLITTCSTPDVDGDTRSLRRLFWGVSWKKPSCSWFRGRTDPDVIVCSWSSFWAAMKSSGLAGFENPRIRNVISPWRSLPGATTAWIT